MLSEFSSRMAGGYESDDLLPRMARILGEGTGARTALVWLKVGDELRAEAIWPPRQDRLAVPMKNGELPDIPDASIALPVVHKGELLGALSLTKPPGDRLTPTEQTLAGDLASGAGSCFATFASPKSSWPDWKISEPLDSDWSLLKTPNDADSNATSMTARSNNWLHLL